MARVDLYNARDLANQAVGTPGVDKTGQAVQDIGQTVTAYTNQYIKAQTAKIEIADNILAETEKIKWENEVYNSIEEAKKNPDNINNPYGLADQTFDMVQNSAQKYAQGISNSRARDMFLQKSTNTVGQAQKAMRNWASDQVTTNAFISVKEGVDAIRLQAAKVPNQAGFDGVLSQGEALIMNAAPVIGMQNAERLREEMRRGVAEDFIYSKIDSSPGSVVSYVKSGMFDGIYDEKEKLTIIGQAESMMKRNEAKRKSANGAEGTDRYQALLQRAYGGTLTLKDVNDEIRRSKIDGVGKNTKQMKNLYRLRDAVVSEGGYKYATSNSLEALNKIEGAFGLIQRKGSGEDTTYVLKNATLNQLQDIQDILDENGVYLEEETLRNKYAVLNEAWRNHVSDNPYVGQKKLGIFQTKFPADEYNQGLVDGYKYIDTNYEDYNKDDAKRIFSMTYNKYYDYERKLPGFTYSKFLEKNKNHVDRAMGRK